MANEDSWHRKWQQPEGLRQEEPQADTEHQQHLSMDNSSRENLEDT